MSAAERAELLRNPDVFAGRAEQVFNVLLQKVDRIEAERSAERIDAEQLQHQLERNYASLRADNQRLEEQHAKAQRDLSASLEAEDAASAQLRADRAELHSTRQEVQRLKDEARGSKEECNRLLEVNEVKAKQICDFEQELRSAYEQLRQAKTASHERAAKLGRQEAASMASAMQATTHQQQIELLQRRLAAGDEHIEKLNNDMSNLRQRKSEALAEITTLHAGVSAEKAQLAVMLDASRARESQTRTEMEHAMTEMRNSMGESAAAAHTMQLKLEETERLSELYRGSLQQERDRVEGLQQRLASAEEACASLREAREQEADAARVALAALEESKSAVEKEATALRLAPPNSLAKDATRAHNLLSEAAPGSPSDTSIPPSLDMLTRAQLYAKYVETMDALAEARAEKEAMSETLTQILTELDVKVPRIVEQRAQLEHLLATHEEMTQRLEVAMHEREAMAARMEQLEAAIGERDTQVTLLDKEVDDLSHQLQLVLAECQRLGAKGVVGAAASPSFGLARSSAASPTAALVPQSESLVPFSSITEMQQKNQQLLRTLRKVGEDHEKELREKDRHAEQQVAAALAELANLRDTSRRQQEAVERLTMQRDMYQGEMRSLPSGADAVITEALPAPGRTTPARHEASDSGRAWETAAVDEANRLREELQHLKEGASESEAQLASQLQLARTAEYSACVRTAQLEADALKLEAQLKVLIDAQSVNGKELKQAKSSEATMSANNEALSLQLKERMQQLVAAEEKSRRYASQAEMTLQEKQLLEQAEVRLRNELQQQASAHIQLQQLLERMQEMQNGWKTSEEASVKRLQAENDSLRLDWVESKAATARAQERAAEERSEADAKLATLQQKYQVSFDEAATAREQVMRLQAQLDAMVNSQEALQLKLRETPGTLAPAAVAGGSEAAGTAVSEELAAVKQEVQRLEASLAAEREHSKQYRLIADAAEKERDDQLKLSAQVKLTSQSKVTVEEEARKAASMELEEAKAAQAARSGELEQVKGELEGVRKLARDAEELARQSKLDRERMAAELEASVQALQVQLDAAKVAQEHAQQKYHSELRSHSDDMQTLTTAKEGQTKAEAALGQAEQRAVDLSAELEASKASFEERASMFTAQSTQLEASLASTKKENELLHKSLRRLTSSGGLSKGREPAEASGTDGSAPMEELLSVVRGEKELLHRKNELLKLEAAGQKDKLDALTRQHQLLQGELAELKDATVMPGAASTHEKLIADARELNLLRDSNALLRQRQDQRDSDLEKALKEVEELKNKVDPLQRDASLKEKGLNDKIAQLEQAKSQIEYWRERASKLLVAGRTSVGIDAHKELEQSNKELKQQVADIQQEKEKVGADLAAAKDLEGKLRGVGTKFKREKQEKENELLEARKAKQLLEGQVEELQKLKSAAKEIAKLEQEKVKLSERCQQLDGQVTELQAKLLALQTEASASQEKAEKFYRGFSRAKEQLAAKLKENDQLKEQLKPAGAAESTSSSAAAAPAPAPATVTNPAPASASSPAPAPGTVPASTAAATPPQSLTPAPTPAPTSTPTLGAAAALATDSGSAPKISSAGRGRGRATGQQGRGAGGARGRGAAIATAAAVAQIAGSEAATLDAEVEAAEPEAEVTSGGQIGKAEQSEAVAEAASTSTDADSAPDAAAVTGSKRGLTQPSTLIASEMPARKQARLPEGSTSTVAAGSAPEAAAEDQVEEDASAPANVDDEPGDIDGP